MSCERNRARFCNLVGATQPAVAALFGGAPQAAEALERIYQAGRNLRPGDAGVPGAALARTQTLQLFAEMQRHGIQPPVHSQSGLPKTDAQRGYALLYQTLDAIRGGKPLPAVAQALVPEGRAQQLSGLAHLGGRSYRCTGCGQYASTEKAHLCPQTMSPEKLGRAVARRTGLPEAAFQDTGGLLSRLLQDARQGPVAMRHPTTGQRAEVTLDGLTRALSQGYRPAGWERLPLARGRAGQLVPILNGRAAPATGETALTEAVSAHTQAVVQAAAACGLHVDEALLRRDIISASQLYPAPLVQGAPATGEAVAAQTGKRYNQGHFFGTEYANKKDAPYPGELIEAGFGQQFRRHERGDALAGEEHHSTARRMGLGWPWRDERGVRVGRTLLGAVGLLRDGQVAEYQDGRVAVTDAAGTLVAVYDPRTGSAGDAEGTPNASSANMAALLAYHALHPSGNPYAQAFAVDLAASRSGGSPLAAMEGAEALLFGSLLAEGDTVTLGAQLQAEEPTADARSTTDTVAAEIREQPGLLAAVNAYQAGDEPALWGTQVEAANDLLADRSDHVAAPGQVWALEAATATLEASGQARCALCQGPFVAQAGESCGRCQAQLPPESQAEALLARLRGGPVLHQAQASAPAAGAAPAARPTGNGATVNVVANTIVENVAAEATQATIGHAQVTVERVEAQASTAQVSQVNVSVETPPALESIFAKMEGAMGSLQEMLASVATLVQQAASVPQTTPQMAPPPSSAESTGATTQVLTALVERMEALATRNVAEALERSSDKALGQRQQQQPGTAGGGREEEEGLDTDPAVRSTASTVERSNASAVSLQRSNAPTLQRLPLRPWPAAEGTGSTWFDRLFTDIELPTPDFYLDRVPAALGGQQREPDMGRRMAVDPYFIQTQELSDIARTMADSLRTAMAAHEGSGQAPMRQRAFGLSGLPGGGKSYICQQLAAALRWRDRDGTVRQGVPYTEVTVPPGTTAQELIGGTGLEAGAQGGTSTVAKLGPIGQALARGGVIQIAEAANAPELFISLNDALQDGKLLVPTTGGGTEEIDIPPSTVVIFTWNPGTAPASSPGGSYGMPSSTLSRLTAFDVPPPTERDMIKSFRGQCQRLVAMNPTKLGHLEPTHAEAEAVVKFHNLVMNGVRQGDLAMERDADLGPRLMGTFWSVSRTHGFPKAVEMVYGSMCTDVGDDHKRQVEVLRQLGVMQFGTDGQRVGTRPPMN